jgi:hypothetical protein
MTTPYSRFSGLLFPITSSTTQGSRSGQSGSSDPAFCSPRRGGVGIHTRIGEAVLSNEEKRRVYEASGERPEKRQSPHCHVAPQSPTKPSHCCADSASGRRRHDSAAAVRQAS